MFKYLPIILFSSYSFAVLANSLKLSNHLTSVIDAKPIERVEPKYPLNEARRGRDGWVVVNFIVEPDGSTSNVVIENSSGSKAFEKSALKAILKWQYQPATENGQAIQQCKTRVQLDFALARKAGITKKFRQLYNRFNKALAEENSLDIETYYQKLQNYNLYTGTEEEARQLAYADYFLAKGDKVNALKALEKSEGFMGAYGFFKRLKNVIPKEEKVADKRMDFQIENEKSMKKRLYPLLHKQLVLALDLQLISKAKHISEKLTLIAPEEKQAMYQQQYDVLVDFVASDKPIITPGNIRERDFWTYYLVRNQFSLMDIQGELDKMDIRCRNKRHVYTIDDKSSWALPESWQGCSILVYGKQGASFTLVEQAKQKGDVQTEARLIKQDTTSS